MQLITSALKLLSCYFNLSIQTKKKPSVFTKALFLSAVQLTLGQGHQLTHYPLLLDLIKTSTGKQQANGVQYWPLILCNIQPSLYPSCLLLLLVNPIYIWLVVCLNPKAQNHPSFAVLMFFLNGESHQWELLHISQSFHYVSDSIPTHPAAMCWTVSGASLFTIFPLPPHHPLPFLAKAIAYQFILQRQTIHKMTICNIF